MKKVIISAIIVLVILCRANENVFGANSVNDHIANGNQHSVALRCNGQVWSWVNNTSGQLGDNTTTQRTAPVQVHGLGNIGFHTNALAVAAGTNHSLAILCDGTVVAWGLNSFGQLGDGTTTQRLFPVPVLGLPVGVRAVAIAAGDLHSMALLENGTVWTW